MKENYFYALLSRMKYINRWGLMRNSRNENLCEHSIDVAFIAHALGIINNKVFNGNVNPEHLAILGMYHDTPEIITGDMPTPVKYYSDVIRNAYAEVEKVAVEELLHGVPEEFRSVYRPLLLEDEEEKEYWLFVKAADKISAYLKCVDERNSGNTDFLDAEKSTLKAIEKMRLKEVDYFMKKFAPAYMKTLDESSDRE